MYCSSEKKLCCFDFCTVALEILGLRTIYFCEKYWWDVSWASIMFHSLHNANSCMQWLSHWSNLCDNIFQVFSLQLWVEVLKSFLIDLQYTFPCADRPSTASLKTTVLFHGWFSYFHLYPLIHYVLFELTSASICLIQTNYIYAILSGLLIVIILWWISEPFPLLSVILYFVIVAISFLKWTGNNDNNNNNNYFYFYYYHLSIYGRHIHDR